MGVFETEGGAVRYSIRNDNTGKVTKYPVRILSVHLTCAPNEKNVLCSGVQYHWQDRTRMNDYSTPLRYVVGCIPTVYLLGPWRIKHACEFIEDISRVPLRKTCSSLIHRPCKVTVDSPFGSLGGGAWPERSRRSRCVIRTFPPTPVRGRLENQTVQAAVR